MLPKSNLRYSGPRTTTTTAQSRQINSGQVNRKRMASNGAGVPIEQKKSYGIGGAGNIRMFCPRAIASPYFRFLALQDCEMKAMRRDWC